MARRSTRGTYGEPSPPGVSCLNAPFALIISSDAAGIPLVISSDAAGIPLVISSDAASIPLVISNDAAGIPLVISSDAAGGVEKSTPLHVHFSQSRRQPPRHSRPDRESLTRFPHFAKLPHIDTHLMALHGLPWCATGRNRPLAHRAPRHSAKNGPSRAPLWRSARLIGGAPNRFLHSLPLGRNDKGRRSVEMTRGWSLTRNSRSITTGILSFPVAHLDAPPGNLGWRSIQMCLPAASGAHRPALRFSGWDGQGGVRDEGNGIQLRPRRGLRLFPLEDVARASSVTAIKRKQPVAMRPAEFLSLVEHRGFEPLTYRLRTYRSTN